MSQSIATHANGYVESLRSAGHPAQRTATNRRQLNYFILWASVHGILLVNELSEDVAERYYDHLLHENDLVDDRPVGPRVRRERLSKLRRLLTYLHAAGITTADLSSSVPIVDQHGTRTRKPTPTTKTLSPC